MKSTRDARRRGSCRDPHNLAWTSDMHAGVNTARSMYSRWALRLLIFNSALNVCVWTASASRVGIIMSGYILIPEKLAAKESEAPLENRAPSSSPAYWRRLHNEVLGEETKHWMKSVRALPEVRRHDSPNG
ncbi:hypothetical protein ElyMa_005881600 [Elysia marginata]|uniref:Uncharacterized protein n=1 Tax=Elysia marginata TaxID=1093978 RepID=A0AAV4G4T4_9GAST|nr:hypothetical protein ElyMa_005881600 [Elysia marginata]